MATTPEPKSDPLSTITTTQTTAKCGDSEQENDIFKKLVETKLPIDQLQQLVQEQRTLAFANIMETFDSITLRITEWLEIAHLTAFTLEQNVKQESEGAKQTEPLETACNDMNPLMQSLLELKDMIEERPDVEPALQTKTKLAITKIQSEWSGLQHFISSVKKTVQDLDEKTHLQLLMENIFLQIDDLSLMIFQFQERRHQQQQPANPENVVVDPALLPGATILSNTVVATEEKPKEDEILVEIDNRVGPLFNDVEKVYTRMTSNTPPEDNNGLLTRKHLLVQERWECLRIEIDELKLELKEDRWLAVFRQVADQVDTMMDGLEKTVNQCLSVHRSSPSVSSSTINTISTTSGNGGTSSPSSDKIRSIEKNFEAKYKYYTPSITKMLMMLGNGIAARVSRNVATLQRHEAMVQRWNQLKSTMDQLRRKDMPDIEKVMLDRPVSPSSSRYSDHSDKSHTSWMDGRFKSPEPNDMLEYRPGTIGSRSKSPFTSLSHHYEDLQRAASGTPNGTRDNHLWWSMNHHSTSPVYGRSSSSTQQQQQQQQQQTRTTSPLSHSRESYPLLGGSGLRSSTSESPCTNASPSRLSNNNYPSRVKTPTTHNKSIKTRHEPPGPERHHLKSDETKSWMQHTKSTIIRNEASRAKTPTNHQRPKSRQQLVRSTTPSMIPRPNEGRASPSMIPRPRSSMTTRNSIQSDTVKSNGPFQHRENKQIRKQFSVPALRSTKDRRDYPDHKDEFRVSRKDTAVK